MLSRTVFIIALSTFAGPVRAAPSGSPKTSIELYNQGVSLMRARKFEQAQAAFEQSLHKRSLAEAHNNLAYCLRKQGETHFDAAVRHYDLAIEMKPKMPQPYMYRGVLHMLMGHRRKAEADLGRLEALGEERLARELSWVLAHGKEKEPEQFFGVSDVLPLRRGTKPPGLLGE
ncbi:MAG: tetratricopeptide repeat protein [Myxococcota bacterium]